MKKNIVFVFYFFQILFSNAFSQHVDPVLLTVLPDSIFESSGAEINSRDSIWTHNDSGGKACIFNIDTLGNLIRILNLSGVTAVDCEDMAQDNEGNYYIGDFGNNYNNRQNLRIYKIPNPDSISGDSVVPEIINFMYPDQLFFPPDSEFLNFDCEAMFHFNDSIYLFSKNRGISTYCRMYRLPDQPGIYIAELVDSFDTQHWVTSADISPSGNVMALFSETYIWLFRSFSGTDFFGGTVTKLNMDYTQKEAIVFINDSSVYITDEKYLGLGGNLYYLDLSQWVGINDEIYSKSDSVCVFPNPAEKYFTLSIPLSAKQVQIFNVTGEIIHDRVVDRQSKVEFCISENGIYFIKVLTGSGSVVVKLVVAD